MSALPKITIALDAMGGDHGVTTVVPAALTSLRKHPELHLILVGDEALLRQHLPTLPDRLSLLHAPEKVDMDELPSHALRNKKRSSMRMAIDLIKHGEAQACVSAGNTGALMATAKFVLKTIPGIDRPAIVTELPGIHGITRVLDLGANVDSCAEHLFQFAVMGSVLASAMDNIERPKVGLLNIGVEEIKGNDQVKHTALLLAKAPELNYVGYVEGDDMFKGVFDVIVCDGFVGNVALKSSEGIAKLFGHTIKQAYKKNWLTRFCALLTYPMFKALKRQFDPDQYNGASFLGLTKTVIKSHGATSPFGFTQAIDKALIEVQKDVPRQIEKNMAKLLNEEEVVS